MKVTLKEWVIFAICAALAIPVVIWGCMAWWKILTHVGML